MGNKKVLVVVDFQNDFVMPNGALYVPEAETITQTIQNHINNDSYCEVIYTLDTHSEEEYKNSLEGKIFPSHCEIATEGWKLSNISPRNNEVSSFINNTTKNVDFSFNDEFVFLKDKFSIFEGNKSYSDFITKRYCFKNTEFFIVGVATNYCVFSSAMGLKKLGFENVSLIESATKGILDDTFDLNIELMKNQNINFI